MSNNKNTLNIENEDIFTSNNSTLHNEEIQDIIEQIPSVFIKWGTLVLFIIIGVFFLIAYYIKFPETLRAPMKVNISNLNGSSSTDYGLANIPQEFISKIKKNQIVTVNFLSYPSEEFGNLYGKVDSFSDTIDSNGYFWIKVKIPHKLITSHQNTIVYRVGMTANIAILIDNTSLFERLFFKIKRI